MTLNEYIITNADRISYDSFLREFSSDEVFFSIDAPSDRLKDGPMTSSSDIELKLQVAKLDIGHVALFYASKHDARLSERFGGLPLLRAAEMVCDMPNIEGMLIQSDGDAWVVARKDALRSVLRDLKA